jgi:predicted flap endonuclease-1-like 5' DNA nuclease
MKNKQLLEKLDRMVSKGLILEAFDTFFTDSVITYDDFGLKTTSKTEKKSMLESFFKEFTKTDEIQLHDSFVDDEMSYSKFTFVFSSDSGHKQRWHEIIRRKWLDGKVVEEYYTNGSLEDLKKSLAKDKKKKKGAKEDKKKDSKKQKKTENKKTDKPAPVVVKPIAVKKPVVAKTAVATNKQTATKPLTAKNTAVKPTVKSTVAKKVTTPKPVVSNKLVATKITKTVPKVVTKVVAKPIVAVVKPKAATTIKKPDNLTLVEGIGPKIAELLIAAKITDFKTLAKTLPSNLSKILAAAGNRFKVHNPTSWPSQAQLAADGKFKELETLKKQLNAGKA